MVFSAWVGSYSCRSESINWWWYSSQWWSTASYHSMQWWWLDLMKECCAPSNSSCLTTKALSITFHVQANTTDSWLEVFATRTTRGSEQVLKCTSVLDKPAVGYLTSSGDVLSSISKALNQKLPTLTTGLLNVGGIAAVYWTMCVRYHLLSRKDYSTRCLQCMFSMNWPYYSWVTDSLYCWVHPAQVSLRVSVRK